MGGVGVAGAKDDVLGALYHNPAGLMAFDGHQATLSMELFKPDRTLTTTAPTQQGLFTGSQRSKSEFVPIPAFGWSSEVIEEKLVIGFGGLGIGGFGVQLVEGVDLSAAYYRAFESDVSGPLYGPLYQNGQEGIPQSNVTSSMFENSFVMQFSFHHH
jgi:hypothetical protein